MVATQGQGNPIWSTEEVILALDLYFKAGRALDGSEPRVIELSELLRSFPYHAKAAKKSSFRNADGVAFKLGNLHNLATGKGFSKVSKTDRKVWQDFGDDPGRVALVAEVIREGLLDLRVISLEVDREEEFAEGRLVTARHLHRERSPQLRHQLLELRKQVASLRCELCECSAHPNFSEFSDAMFEAHHQMPLELGMRKTRVADLALLCANCHRIVHRVMRTYRKWLSVDDVKLILSERKG